jgi:SAM-dependent methyltransferase
MRCEACGTGELRPFADLGEVPVFCGVHWADEQQAAASPVGRMRLGVCAGCGYVRNLDFDPSALVYDTTMDTNLHHSPAFQRFSAELAEHLSSRYELAGKHTLDVGCGQGEFLRELAHLGGCTGDGFDAMYSGPLGPTGDGVVFHSRLAPRGSALRRFDFVTSRHWFEHLDDPYDFLVDLREQAGDREVCGYLEVPDAEYDLATAGWEVIYPHVSYFGAHALHTIAERAGWRVEDSGTWFRGMFRYLEISVNRSGPRFGQRPETDASSLLAATRDFADRHHAERTRWRRTIVDLIDDDARPVLWGAGSRGVQFLSFADPEQRLAAVVDVNPRKWGRYLPVTAHRVDTPESLIELKPRAVIITNPAYAEEIGARLKALGITADLLIA